VTRGGLPLVRAAALALGLAGSVGWNGASTTADVRALTDAFKEIATGFRELHPNARVVLSSAHSKFSSTIV
jgi:hypothetical protein